ncbi:MAG: hypothetical protein V3U43_02850, partial [Pseudomonadales bacterium]
RRCRGAEFSPSQARGFRSHGIFQDERLSTDEEAAQEASEQSHPGILAGVEKSNDFRLDEVFADYALLSPPPSMPLTLRNN